MLDAWDRGVGSGLEVTQYGDGEVEQTCGLGQWTWQGVDDRAGGLGDVALPEGCGVVSIAVGPVEAQRVSERTCCLRVSQW